MFSNSQSARPPNTAHDSMSKQLQDIQLIMHSKVIHTRQVYKQTVTNKYDTCHVN